MGKKVLIVEDDADSCELTADALRAQGYTVECSGDGMEALFRAKAFQPDIVVLDLGLPKLDGIYLAELWRRDPAMCKVPLIAVSAHLDAHNTSRALSAGFVETLAKPFSIRELRDTVELVLSTVALSRSG